MKPLRGTLPTIAEVVQEQEEGSWLSARPPSRGLSTEVLFPARPYHGGRTPPSPASWPLVAFTEASEDRWQPRERPCTPFLSASRRWGRAVPPLVAAADPLERSAAGYAVPRPSPMDAARMRRLLPSAAVVHERLVVAHCVCCPGDCRRLVRLAPGAANGTADDPVQRDRDHPVSDRPTRRTGCWYWLARFLICFRCVRPDQRHRAARRRSNRFHPYRSTVATARTAMRSGSSNSMAAQLLAVRRREPLGEDS